MGQECLIGARTAPDLGVIKIGSGSVVRDGSCFRPPNRIPASGEIGETKMQIAQHAILNSHSSGMTPKRAMTIGAVGLLHVAAIYGLMNGMIAKVFQPVPPPIIVTMEKAVDTKPIPVPPQPQLRQPAEPREATIPVPELTIANTDPTPTLDLRPTPVDPQPAMPDTNAAGLTNTHSVPPYPTEARTLAHQGTVLLNMMVTAQGDVVSATVVTSSGFAELDQAAISWVISHWKYKPAVQNGVAVPSQTQAAVKFDLKTARR
jgi:protein TonB